MQIVLLFLLLVVTSAANALPSAVQTTPMQLNGLWQQYQSGNEHTVDAYYPHFPCFKKASEQTNIPLTLLLAMARGESNFSSDAVSKANAIGVMQIQWPGTAKHLGITEKKKLYDPCLNIDAGARYIDELIQRYEGNLYLALAAYNYGPGRIQVGSSPNAIPDGAHWYSEYVYDHLTYILDAQIQDYSQTLSHTLITFNRPYRAKDFVIQMQKKAPEVRFDWFKKPFDRFEVVVFFENESQKRKASKVLKRLGFTL